VQQKIHSVVLQSCLTDSPIMLNSIKYYQTIQNLILQSSYSYIAFPHIAASVRLPGPPILLQLLTLCILQMYVYPALYKYLPWRVECFQHNSRLQMTLCIIRLTTHGTCSTTCGVDNVILTQTLHTLLFMQLIFSLSSKNITGSSGKV